MTAPVMPPIVTEEETSFASDLLTDDQEADYPDNFRVSWGSFVVACVGFMVYQYNLFVIGTVILAMSVTPDVGPYTQTEGAVTRAIKLLGAMFGQLTFGWVADALGRRVACLLTLMLVLVGALGSSLSAPVLGISIYWCLSVWQLVLGVGVGGEYPLSASMSRESTSDLRTVGLTFCMQGFGFILGPIVVLVLLYLFPSNTSEDLNIVWRGALGFSAIPAALLLYPRYTMHNSSSYDKARITDRYKKPLLQQLGRTSRRRLLGTAGCWFLFDVSFYGNSILATQAFAAMRLTADGNPQSPHDQIASAAWSLLAVALLGLPGYLVALSSLPHMGLRAMQVTGFAAISVVFSLISSQYGRMSDTTFVVLYGLTFFFSNFGPNFTTFVLPAVLFDTSTRARCHGVSAACGKLGGAVGVYVMSTMMEQKDRTTSPIPDVCMFCAFTSAAGLLLTILCIDRSPERVARSFDRKEHRAFVRASAGYQTLERGG